MVCSKSSHYLSRPFRGLFVILVLCKPYHPAWSICQRHGALTLVLVKRGKFAVCGTAEDGCSVAVGITVVGDQYYNSAISNEKLELLADMGISYWGYPLLHYMVTTEGS
jgi:hypothetical protein